jgi:hypothetical protein
MDKDAMLTPLLRLDGCSIEDLGHRLLKYGENAEAVASQYMEFLSEMLDMT